MMNDHGDLKTPGLTPAETAVRYLLDRIRLDADLRYLMLDTEAMHLLCAAEAQRVGQTREMIEGVYRMPASANAGREPRLKVYRDMRDALEDLVEDWDSVGEDVPVPDAINDDDHWNAARQVIERADKAAR